jgi:hypothetical protein
MAMPWPPPAHADAIPNWPPERCNSRATVVV